MAKPGVEFSTSCLTSASPREVASRVVDAVAGVSAVSVTTRGSGEVIATRAYRPTWALIMAAATTILLFVGLLFLFMKRSETLTVSAVTVGDYAMVTSSGRSSAEFIGRLTKALVTLSDVTDVDGGPFTPPILASASTEMATLAPKR